MADKEKGKEDKGRDKDEAPAPPKAEGNGKKMLIMAGVPVLAMVLGVVITLNMVNRWKPKDPAVIESESRKKTEEAEREKMTEMGSTQEVPDIVVNLAGDGERFLKTTLVLEYEEKVVEGGGGGHGEGKGPTGNPEITKRLPKIRDRCIEILSAKTYEELFKDPDGKKKVLTQIRNELNKMFPEPEMIKGAYFTSFLVQ